MKQFSLKTRISVDLNFFSDKNAVQLTGILCTLYQILSKTNVFIPRDLKKVKSIISPKTFYLRFVPFYPYLFLDHCKIMFNIFYCYYRLLCRHKKCIHSSSIKKQDRNDEPIKFSTSRAASRGAVLDFTTQYIEAPWYQPYCIGLSFLAVMLYFIFFSEDMGNEDIDERLYGVSQAMQEKQLKTYIKYCIANGLPTEESEKKLVQILKEKEIKSKKSTKEASV